MENDPAFKFGGLRRKGILAENMLDHPLVSIVTVIFNGYPYVEGCLESVLRQNYPNIEHIVLDGGSTDGTLNVLRQYDDLIAFWKSEPDGGVYDAWNKGVSEARGEWICFLGVDDEFLPGAVGAYMELATKNAEADYLSSRVNWAHPSGYMRIIGRPWSWNKFRISMCTAHVGSMHRRSLYNRLGGYDTSYRSAADYEFLLRARGQLKTAFMPAVTVHMRAGGVSDDSTALTEAKRAKITTGGRSPLLAQIELQVARVKFVFRPLRRTLARITGR